MTLASPENRTAQISIFDPDSETVATRLSTTCGLRWDAWVADAVQSIKQTVIPHVVGLAEIALASSGSSEEHAREIRESALVCSNNHPTSSQRGGGDDQIVSAAGPP